MEIKASDLNFLWIPVERKIISIATRRLTTEDICQLSYMGKVNTFTRHKGFGTLVEIQGETRPAYVGDWIVKTEYMITDTVHIDLNVFSNQEFVAKYAIIEKEDKGNAQGK